MVAVSTSFPSSNRFDVPSTMTCCARMVEAISCITLSHRLVLVCRTGVEELTGVNLAGIEMLCVVNIDWK